MQDLENWLQNRVKGKSILQAYKQHGSLSTVNQKHLMDEIYVQVFASKWDIGNKTCSELAKKIIKIFPNEKIDLYYMPPKKTGSNQIHSKGLIPNKLRNCNRYFKSIRTENKKVVENVEFEKLVNG